MFINCLLRVALALFCLDDDSFESQDGWLHARRHVNGDAFVHDHRPGVVGERDLDLTGLAWLERLSGPFCRCAATGRDHTSDEYRNVGLVLIYKGAGLRSAGLGKRPEIVDGLRERQLLVLLLLWRGSLLSHDIH